MIEILIVSLFVSGMQHAYDMIVIGLKGGNYIAITLILKMKPRSSLLNCKVLTIF